MERVAINSPGMGVIIVAPGSAWEGFQPRSGRSHRSPRHRLGLLKNNNRALEGHFNQGTEHMAHSYCKIYVHIIFSTKNRMRWLDDAIRDRVHAYLATLVRDAGCPFVIVGGTDDHIHILADIGKSVQPVDMIGKIKQASSKFVKSLGNQYNEFYWQGGYGMFSVGPTRVNDVKTYIERQVEHHRKQSFQDEFLAFLNKYEIEYNEKYIWE